ncbi:MAG: ATP-grasp domain-containing protein, partial [Bacteroidetes bacterium]
LTNFEEVYQFGKNVDIITIEIENVNTEALEKLATEGKKIFPQPKIIALIQDKGLQKQFYQEHKIPTLPFEIIENKQKTIDYFQKNPQKYFQKLRRGGYDGKGVQKLFTENDFELLFDSPSVLELAFPIEKEIAVLVAKNEKGEIKTFPPVEMIFDDKLNLVDYLVSPANLSENQTKIVENLAIQVISALDMVGLLAVEMFLGKDEKIYVNEIAPRPHNSGHQTIEGNITSQYQQLWRSILNMPLGNTKNISHSAMLNIIGQHNGLAEYPFMTEILAMENVFVHLYGKKISKIGRKMGHITILSENLEELKQKIHQIKKIF